MSIPCSATEHALNDLRNRGKRKIDNRLGISQKKRLPFWLSIDPPSGGFSFQPILSILEVLLTINQLK